MAQTGDKPAQETEKSPPYTAPKGASKELVHVAGGDTFPYVAAADWIVLRRDEKPRAEMFFVSYIRKDTGNRPVTFVFNGGPGASSVYLHMGAVGPRRIDLEERGAPLPPPHALVDNEESWLRFTDLVFIDPIGTGLSRMIDEGKKDTDKKPDAKKDVEYWQVKRDLESIGEFIRTYLSRTGRWESPVYIAGESYGGFRVAKLTRMLQEQYGVGLSGAIIISPALEFALLDGSDYDDLMWLDTFATMSAAAVWHKKARKARDGEGHVSYAGRAGVFALTELLPILAGGDMLGADRRLRVLEEAADWIGVPRPVMVARNGRLPIDWFVKNLLREQGLHLGLYDASVTVKDPYPDRDGWSGPDPTLHIMERVFAAGVNSQVRTVIGLETDRDYALISGEANEAWKNDTRKHAFDSQTGSVDDLRYGLSLNPDMKVWISHGVFDLVTPYFASERITRLMKLDPERRGKLTVKHYDGGHMFYTWRASRRAFFEDMRIFYTEGRPR